MTTDAKILKLVSELANKISLIKRDECLEDVLSSIKYSAPELWDLRIVHVSEWCEENLVPDSEEGNKAQELWDEFNSKAKAILNNG